MFYGCVIFVLKLKSKIRFCRFAPSVCPKPGDIKCNFFFSFVYLCFKALSFVELFQSGFLLGLLLVLSADRTGLDFGSHKTKLLLLFCTIGMREARRSQITLLFCSFVYLCVKGLSFV